MYLLRIKTKMFDFTYVVVVLDSGDSCASSFSIFTILAATMKLTFKLENSFVVVKIIMTLSIHVYESICTCMYVQYGAYIYMIYI